MFTPQQPSGRSRASPFTPNPRGGPRSSQNKRTSGLFTPNRRASANVSRSHIGSRSLTTSQIVDETAQHRVENYGVPLPVLITEALTLADRNTEITVKIDPSGWAWLVAGRKLFIWKYKASGSGRGIQCKELSLPPSDLAHNAARVCVLPHHSENQPPACIAVTPEGVVRYWSNIAYESSTAEISAELKGEETDCVVNCQPYGCLLATTTSSLVLLLPSQGQNVIVCQPIKSSQGMFAGFGRRMSSFIFGATPSQTSGMPLQAVVSGPEEEDSRPFYVLSGTLLQKWNLSDSHTEKISFQVDVDRLYKEALAKQLWGQESVQLPQLKTWLLDIQTTSYGVMILGAGVNIESTDTLHYSIMSLSTSHDIPPTSLDSFINIDHVDKYSERNEEKVLGYQLLVPGSGNNSAYVYNRNTIFIVNQEGENSATDKMELQGVHDMYLGAGSTDGKALFFSNSHGLFSLSPQNHIDTSILEESGHDPFTQNDGSMMGNNLPQVTELSQSDSKSARLKAAFLSSISGNIQQAQSILSELFPPELSSEDGTGSEVDELVVGLSCDVIDDYPASDPRWAQNIKQGDVTNSSSSLLILQQLKDKEKAHSYLIAFLKKLHLWDRLSIINVNSTYMSTTSVLCEHAEKLTAAITLRQLQTEHHTDIIDECIKHVFKMRGENLRRLPSGLTPQDIFYREVSRIEEVIEALVELETDTLEKEPSPQRRVTLITAVNSIIEGMLTTALQYRQSKAEAYISPTILGLQQEYKPWTSTGGPRGLRTLLFKQVNLTVEGAVTEIKDDDTKNVVFQQLLVISDILLDGYSNQLESLRRSDGNEEAYITLEQKYQQERQNLITPLVENEEYERALSLAEKYSDFQTLIMVCEKTNNNERLQRYVEQYNEQGFSTVLFDWYMKHGRRGRLFSQQIGNSRDLGQFLESDNNRYLSWLHDISNQQYTQAHETLLDLARTETTFASKKKTLLSLSKLTALASDNQSPDMKERMDEIDDQLDLILHQEQLPPDSLQHLGMDTNNMSVLKPQEIIELYISEINAVATEYEFKKALDLLQYLDQEDDDIDINELRLHIWSKAVLRDNWKDNKASDPLDTIKDTIFFKTVDLAYNEGLDLTEYLPSVEEILQSEELGDLRNHPNFQFLIKAGYEHLQSVM
ncbi:hypothetical protein LOTGIDRAFT_233315 [Lottia gigantea]|uniref:Nucleoporin Nup133/Nup155-like C-terminal domain-containing protein n=1 Tax=Lottia gigantea TaxID=225164 RepID=V4AAF7_LOTGI|nr:hypothetical protein LOTGIDRAFT_233315 [Lottia gigantea]ESO92060.1 hypothetical protein LOTGIDRAFT_233315 [Lottia gigantea]